MPSDPLRELVLPRLDGLRKSGNMWAARCPAHQDGHASLMVGPGKDHPVVFHCLAAETRVVTRQGTAPIVDLAGGVHELLVPATAGGPAQWQKCPVESFGVQRLWRVTLRRHSATKVIHATEGHRWFTQVRGSAPRVEVTTAGLRTGDRLASILPRRTVRTVSSFGVAHGFVFGDGTVTSRGVESAAQFCGLKDEALLPYFPDMRVRQYGQAKRIFGLPRFFKSVPSITESPAYLLGWLAGYFAADGSVEGHCAAISSADRDALEFVRDVCTRLGIVTYPIRCQSRQGYGPAPRDLFKVTLRGADLWPEFFVLPSHRGKWVGDQSQHSREAWTVDSITPTDREEEVYCATVEGSRAFALEDFILTGNCHAGCPAESILTALGLTWAELSAPRAERASDGEWTPNGPAVAIYDYRDEHGGLLYQVCRSANKGFAQRRPDKAKGSGWSWSLGTTRRVIYRLPEVLAAIPDGRPVWITEGEKDVHTLELRNHVATTNSGGAGKWQPEFAEAFRDAVVLIVADRDAPGRAHARAVAASLEGIADQVRIVEAAEGKDATDHFAAGLGVGDFVETWDSDQPWADDPTDPDVWEFVRTGDPEYDWLVPNLIERGDRLILTGFEGLGKSMVTRQLATMMAAGLHPFTHEEIPPRKVLFVDCENSLPQSRRKFAALAALSIQYQRRVPDRGLILIHRPAGIDLSRDEDTAWLRERAWAHRPDLLCVGPFYKLHISDMNDEMAARRVLGVLDGIRAKFGCAVVVEAHSPHGEGGRTRSVRPVGSSLLLRWPEFGYGLSPRNDEVSRVDFKRWRGPRDERDWPQRLAHGGPGRWPWVPASGGPE